MAPDVEVINLDTDDESHGQLAVVPYAGAGAGAAAEVIEISDSDEPMEESPLSSRARSTF